MRSAAPRGNDAVAMRANFGSVQLLVEHHGAAFFEHCRPTGLRGCRVAGIAAAILGFLRRWSWAVVWRGGDGRSAVSRPRVFLVKVVELAQ